MKTLMNVLGGAYTLILFIVIGFCLLAYVWEVIEELKDEEEKKFYETFGYLPGQKES